MIVNEFEDSHLFNVSSLKLIDKYTHFSSDSARNLFQGFLKGYAIIFSKESVIDLSLGVGLLRFASLFAMARTDFIVQLHLDLDTYNDLDTASTFRGHRPWKVLSAASDHGKSLSLRYIKT